MGAANTTGNAAIRLIIDSRLQNVCLVGMAVNKLCAVAHLDEEAAFGVELCAVEAVTNSVEHAYGGQSGHDVELVLTLGDSQLSIEVKDQRIVSVSGIDKQRVGQVAAIIRDFKRPEPYKGTGVRYVGEYVRRKEGKAGAAA